jgi:hypothetical protein
MRFERTKFSLKKLDYMYEVLFDAVKVQIKVFTAEKIFDE